MPAKPIVASPFSGRSLATKYTIFNPGCMSITITNTYLSVQRYKHYAPVGRKKILTTTTAYYFTRAPSSPARSTVGLHPDEKIFQVTADSGVYLYIISVDTLRLVTPKIWDESKQLEFPLEEGSPQSCEPSWHLLIANSLKKRPRKSTLGTFMILPNSALAGMWWALCGIMSATACGLIRWMRANLTSRPTI
jgi:hypothetical protein